MIAAAAPAAAPTVATRRLGAAAIVLAAGIAAISLLGPLGAGAIDYRIPAGILHRQLLGLDAVALAVVAPLSVVAGVLCRRGRAAGPILALGPAAFAAYMVPQYVFGPAYLRLPGNNEQFFPLHLGLFAVAVVVGVTAWHVADTGRLPPARPRRTARGAGVLLPAAALVTFSRYVPALADAMSASPTAADYRAGPT